jgi:pleckstrin homology domain-containing family G member 4
VSSNTSVQTVVSNHVQSNSNINNNNNNNLPPTPSSLNNHRLSAAIESQTNLNQSDSLSSLTIMGGQQPQLMTMSMISMSDDPLLIADVADILHPQYAIITGGRSKEGCPLITFPDHNNFHTLSDSDYQKLICYLSSVPS